MTSDEFWPEAAGYGRSVAAARPVAMQTTARPAGNRYPGSIDYNDTRGGYSDAFAGYNDAPAAAGWAAGPEEESWLEWQDRHDWGPPPELHPDHPSAPVPRVYLPDTHPSGPMWSPRSPGASGRQGPRRPAAPPARGSGGNPGRHSAVTTTATVGYLTVHHEVNNFERRPDPMRRRDAGYQQQAGPRSSEYTDYRGENGPFVPGPGPAAEWLEDDRSPDEDPLWMAGQVLTLADDKAAQVAQEAQADATSIREAAQREATAVREAAAREAAEVRARLDTLTGELGRVLAAYVSEALADPAAPPTAPAHHRAEPALPSAEPALPGAASAPPATKPARPDTTPGTRPTRPAKPRTTPAGPRTAPVKKAQKKPGRQKNAMRIAKLSTAALLILALGSSAAEIGAHGYKFFVFRENGQGDSPDGPTDLQFLAQQAKAAHATPKGRHHRPPQQTATSTTKG